MVALAEGYGIFLLVPVVLGLGLLARFGGLLVTVWQVRRLRRRGDEAGAVALEDRYETEQIARKWN